ncbi:MULTISPECIES: MFS transporter [Lactiplantibacillus]|uniref:MFS transporter n=1 Tax=Lactiplantibacillus TaxID=2767842 RepID=UPI0020A7A7DE|nr:MULTISPECIES: MFS transporter [Lactiplantibacillus]
MKNLARNRAFVTLTAADLFETIGTSLFNIILLTYARTFAQASLMVSIVSVATVLPGIFSIMTGRLADSQPNKRGWLAGLKFVQAGLYLVLAQLITGKQVGLLLIIIVINLCSDVFGMFSGSLRMPLLQAKVASEQQEEAIGINQGIGVLMQTMGQALGVSILAATGNYQVAGYLNALTFLIAGIVLLSGYGTLKMPTIAAAATPSFRQLLQQVRRVMESGTHMNVLGLLGSPLVIECGRRKCRRLVEFVLDPPRGLFTAFVWSGGLSDEYRHCDRQYCWELVTYRLVSEMVVSQCHVNNYDHVCGLVYQFAQLAELLVGSGNYDDWWILHGTSKS